MNCKQARKLVPGWLDGTLPAASQEALELHLGRCGPCASEALELKSVLAALRRLPGPCAAPSGFAAGVMQRLHQEAPPAGRLARFPLRALAVAASFLFLLGMNSILVGQFLAGRLAGNVPAPIGGEAPAAPVEEAGPPQDREAPPSPANAAVDAPAPVEGAKEEPAVPAQVVPAVPAPGALPVAQAQIEPAPEEVPEPAPALERQVRVAAIDPAAIPEPEVFVEQKRVTEGVLVKVAVEGIEEASRKLKEAAEAQGFAPVMESLILSHDGRLIKLYRFELPFMLANQFVSRTSSLGKVVGENRSAEDISGEYRQRLERYRELAGQALSVEGAEAEALFLEMDALVTELVTLHRKAQGIKSVTVWLEN